MIDVTRITYINWFLMILVQQYVVCPGVLKARIYLVQIKSGPYVYGEIHGRYNV